MSRATTFGVSWQRAAVIALLAGAAAGAGAAPVTVHYLKDAQARNSSGTGTVSPNIFFATPVAGLHQNSFTQTTETVSASGGGATASTTYAASIGPGVLHGSSVSQVTGSFSGTGGLSTSSDQVFSITDTLHVTGGSPGGTINLSFTLTLDAVFTAVNIPPSGGIECDLGLGALWLNVGTVRIQTLKDNVCSNSPTLTAQGSISVTEGTDIDIEYGMQMFSQALVGAGNILGSYTGVDASHTGRIAFTAPAGVQISALSGYDYTLGSGGPNGVPEPATGALVGLAGLALAAARRRRVS